MAGEDPTAAAIAAADSAVALAEASAQTGEAQAALAYQLSTQVLQDNNWLAIVPLDALVLEVITAGLQAYEQVGTARAAAAQEVQAAFSAATSLASTDLQQYIQQFARISGGKG